MIRNRATPVGLAACLIAAALVGGPAAVAGERWVVPTTQRTQAADTRPNTFVRHLVGGTLYDVKIWTLCPDTGETPRPQVVWQGNERRGVYGISVQYSNTPYGRSTILKSVTMTLRGKRARNLTSSELKPLLNVGRGAYVFLPDQWPYPRKKGQRPAQVSTWEASFHDKRICRQLNDPLPL